MVNKSNNCFYYIRYTYLMKYILKHIHFGILLCVPKIRRKLFSTSSYFCPVAQNGFFFIAFFLSKIKQTQFLFLILLAREYCNVVFRNVNVVPRLELESYIKSKYNSVHQKTSLYLMSPWFGSSKHPAPRNTYTKNTWICPSEEIIDR